MQLSEIIRNVLLQLGYSLKFITALPCACNVRILLQIPSLYRMPGGECKRRELSFFQQRAGCLFTKGKLMGCCAHIYHNNNRLVEKADRRTHNILRERGKGRKKGKRRMMAEGHGCCHRRRRRAAFPSAAAVIIITVQVMILLCSLFPGCSAFLLFFSAPYIHSLGG